VLLVPLVLPISTIYLGLSSFHSSVVLELDAGMPNCQRHSSTSSNANDPAKLSTVLGGLVFSLWFWACASCSGPGVVPCPVLLETPCCPDLLPFTCCSVVVLPPLFPISVRRPLCLVDCWVNLVEGYELKYEVSSSVLRRCGVWSMIPVSAGSLGTRKCRSCCRRSLLPHKDNTI
jgi:hypothetical protein